MSECNYEIKEIANHVGFSDTIAKLVPAITKAQAEVGKLVKKGEAIVRNDNASKSYKYTYQRLPEILEAIREPLINNSLGFTQMPGYENGIVSVVTIVTHDSGEHLICRTSIPVLKNKFGNITDQAVGSATTYARRYAIAAIMAIADTEDDDGKMAMPDEQWDNRQQRSQPSQGSHRRDQDPRNRQQRSQQQSKPATQPQNHGNPVELSQGDSPATIFWKYVNSVGIMDVSRQIVEDCTKDGVRDFSAALEMAKQHYDSMKGDQNGSTSDTDAPAGEHPAESAE